MGAHTPIFSHRRAPSPPGRWRSAPWRSPSPPSPARPLAVGVTPGLAVSLLAEGVVGRGLAYLGYYVLVARAGATFASYYAFLVPPLGVACAALARGEAISPRHLAGVAVVLLGLALLTRRTSLFSRRPTPSSARR